jgi:chromosome segregation ATPase
MSTSTRRDDRAEPDDEPSSSRIDVVNVGGGAAGESAASAMVSLRRELAKIHQQAAAVERSLEEQRRDRSEALDRSERAIERAIQLETQLAAVEAEATSVRKMHEGSLVELRSVRAERDDLSRAIAEAKSATAELIAQATAQTRQAKDEAASARKAAEIAEQDAALVGDQATRVRAEAAKLRDEADAARIELTRARDELASAHDEAVQLREELAKARSEATKAGEDLTKARAESARAREDLARAREDSARDRTAAERVGRELEGALASSALMEQRATTASRAHAALEQSVRRLREEIASAFARVGQPSPPPPLPASPILSIAPEMMESVPPEAPSTPPAVEQVKPAKD